MEAGAEIVGGEAEDFADFGADAGAVGVGVVEGGEGGGDAAGEAGREGCRYGVECVGCCEYYCRGRLLDSVLRGGRFDGEGREIYP